MLAINSKQAEHILCSAVYFLVRYTYTNADILSTPV